MNDIDPLIEGIGPSQSHSNADERLSGWDVTTGSHAEPNGTRGDRRWLLITGAIVVLLWMSYFAGISALLDLGNPHFTPKIYVPRAIVTLVGVVISFVVVGMQSRLGSPTLTQRAAIALASATIAPALQALINVRVFNIYFPATSPSFGWVALISDYGWRIWIWIAVSGLILAMSYAGDIRERERRILGLESLAHSAQLRALRLQLNPHFLFNALNSIAGLISAKRVADAETMTENLADFLRMTLALDPHRLITLEEELQLQSLYLEIEKKRFSDRLTVRVDVPADLRRTLVPSLITQPLIENSVKYAVARSTRPVELAIAARKLNGQLEIIVADSGGDGEEAMKDGACLGLHNVTHRIRMHYGDRASLTAERHETGFRNRILIPLEFSE